MQGAESLAGRGSLQSWEWMHLLKEQVWCWERVGRTQGGAPGHPAVRTVIECTARLCVGSCPGPG